MLCRKHVTEPWFSFIAAGVKTCEGRLWKGEFRVLEVGDTLEFYCGESSCRARVVGVARYPTFESYLLGEGLDACLPGVRTMEEGVAVYRAYYSEEEEAMYGVVGIRLELGA